LVTSLMQRFGGGHPFGSLRSMLVFVAAGVAGCALAALVAALTLLNQSQDWSFALQFFTTWWLGDLTAILVLTPLLLAWSDLVEQPRSNQQRMHLFVFLALFVLGLNLFFAPPEQFGLRAPIFFLLLPMLVWGAVSFRPPEISLILFVFAGFTLYRTLNGAGVYVGSDLQLSLLQLQSMVCVVAASLHAMNATMQERYRLNRHLQHSNEELEQTVRERMLALEQANRHLQERVQQQSRSEKRLQESEDRLQLITQATTDGIWDWEPARRHFRYSTRFKSLLGYDQFDVLPNSLRFWLRRVPAEDRVGLLRACRDHLQRRTPLNARFRLRNKAGRLRWYRVLGQATWNERGETLLLAGSISDVDTEQSAHDILLSEKRLLERMTSGARVGEVLQLAAELLCVRFRDGGCAILLLDESDVNTVLAAQVGVSSPLVEFMAGIKVGPRAVGAAAAIYFNTQLVVDDIQQYADWRPYLGLLRHTGLQACWAHPIRNRHGSVLGAIALHFTFRCFPSIEEGEYLDRVSRLVGIAVEQDATRTVLQNSEQRYRELYHSNPAMFFSLDGSSVIRSVNQFGAEHLGYSPAELVGKDYNVLIEEFSRDSLREALRQAIESPGKVQVFEARKQCADGRWLWVRDSLRSMGTQQGRTEVLVVAEDITDIRELSDRLAYQAAHDPLTGLINRRKFEAELVSAIYEANSRNLSHALCYLDLDLFKVINDTCGHAAGDELLRQLGRLLEDAVAGQGLIARLGGDEFGLLIRDCEMEAVLQLAANVRDSIAEHQFVWERRPYHVGVSIGVVRIGQETSNLTTLMSAADSACYAAKEGGRNRIHVYRQDDKELEQRRGEMQWVTRIPRGIRENRFALAVQEIYATSTTLGQERHVELLLRYRRQDGQWIAPGMFLPAAERYNMATMLDRWVFVQLATLLQQHPELVEQGWVFNVNLSGQSVTNDEFLHFIIDRTRELNLPTRGICFEITETSAITNLSRAQHFIASLKALGCRFALDDFGSGLSTFGYLKGLPVDYIKIDGQFIRDIEKDAIDFAIVKSINEVGHVLGKQTIAECVENGEIVRMLTGIGVDWMQGFQLAMPLMLDAWLQQISAEDASAQGPMHGVLDQMG
ncbi:MAG TPA: EAL domain-containing protein, partial [Dongiaceae bacterium]|nr:EAL domain-containing protein [Dongiaceae bacterium]